jgi:hypothetical protein
VAQLLEQAQHERLVDGIVFRQQDAQAGSRLAQAVTGDDPAGRLLCRSAEGRPYGLQKFLFLNWLDQVNRNTQLAAAGSPRCASEVSIMMMVPVSSGSS